MISNAGLMVSEAAIGISDAGLMISVDELIISDSEWMISFVAMMISDAMVIISFAAIDDSKCRTSHFRCCNEVSDAGLVISDTELIIPITSCLS